MSPQHNLTLPTGAQGPMVARVRLPADDPNRRKTCTVFTRAIALTDITVRKRQRTYRPFLAAVTVFVMCLIDVGTHFIAGATSDRSKD